MKLLFKFTFKHAVFCSFIYYLIDYQWEFDALSQIRVYVLQHYTKATVYHARKKSEYLIYIFILPNLPLHGTLSQLTKHFIVIISLSISSE